MAVLAATVATVVWQLAGRTLLVEQAGRVALDPVLPHTTQQITAETLFTVIPLAAMPHRQSMWRGTPAVLPLAARRRGAPPTVATRPVEQLRAVRPRLVARPAATPLAVAIVAATEEMAPAVSGLVARALAVPAELPTVAVLLLVAVALAGPAAQPAPVFLAMPLPETAATRVRVQ